MRACLACLLGLASALKVQEMVDASFREMAASGLQPVPQANLRAEERCYVQCTRGGPLGLEMCTSACADKMLATANVEQRNYSHSLPCWFLRSPRVPSVCAEKIAAEGTQLLRSYAKAALSQEQSIKLWTQPILFLGDSLAHGMHAAAVCAAARAGVEPVGGARLTLASTKGRLPYNSSKVGAAAARQRIGLVNPEFRSAAKRMTESGGGTLVACIGMHYNNHPTSGLMSSLLHPRPGTIVEMIVTLSREDFREDVRLHMPTRTLHRTRPFSPCLCRHPKPQPMTPNIHAPQHLYRLPCFSPSSQALRPAASTAVLS